ncbi:MAG TPA: GGDEF domain-containing protein [Gaiellaceae bacterium]|jgi:diguanylate cyclase (GGDEF)-like protein|nr:GGDEF domain-containing protein [Gaiellaceae bacterium]
MSFEPIEISDLSLSGSLPSLPTVALDVLRICQDSASDIGDLAEGLSRDPILASRVLQMANSAYYNRGTEVTSLNRAAVMLGLRALKVLALGFTLANELPSQGESGGFDLQLFWHRSLVNAVAGRSIATAIRSTKTEEAFLCGLLSQIGKLALAKAAPERYAVAVETGGAWPSEETEREVIGHTSSEVGELLLAQWHVPLSIVHGATYAYREDDIPDDAPRESRDLAGITALAVATGDILFSPHAAAGLKRLHEEAERAFGLHKETVAGILDGLHEGVLESAEAFAVQLPPGHSYQQILDEAHAQLLSVSLNTVIDLEQTASALAELAGENEVLQARALTDNLTELANRAALEDALSREVYRRMRSEHEDDALGVLMVDIDKFKSVNDRYGHADGDEILRHVARTMQGVTRRADLLARYGGEEFCVVMARTSHAGLTAAAERLRRAVEGHPAVLGSGEEVRLTISVGAAASAEIDDPTGGKQLLEVADAALYRAKANGRNRVEIAPRPAPATAA